LRAPTARIKRTSALNRPTESYPTPARPDRPGPGPERLAYRLAEAAVALGLSRRTIERLRASGRFPKPDLRVGKVPLWSRQTLIAWIKEGGQV
jgi:predicted DNA-binding transcriptional regulator AlpA